MTNNIAQSIKEAYPNLSNKEIESLLDKLLEIIATKISAGEQLASVKKKDTGDIELSVFQIEPIPTEVYFDQEIENLSSDEREQITLRITAPKLLTIDGFINLVVNHAKAVDFIYFLLYFVAYGSRKEILALCDFINNATDKDSLQRTDFYKVLKSAKTQNLRVTSVHYGSPINIDLLGIGNILQASRDLIKDVSWRANHEKKLAELERKNKSVEIERAKIEITAQKLALEKTSAEIALQKIELLERLNSLPLSNDEKQLIVSAMVPKLLTLVEKKPPRLLNSGRDSRNQRAG